MCRYLSGLGGVLWKCKTFGKLRFKGLCTLDVGCFICESFAGKIVLNSWLGSEYFYTGWERPAADVGRTFWIFTSCAAQMSRLSSSDSIERCSLNETRIMKTTILKTIDGKVWPISWSSCCYVFFDEAQHLLKSLKLSHRRPKMHPEPAMFQLLFEEVPSLSLLWRRGWPKTSVCPVKTFLFIHFPVILLQIRSITRCEEY